MAAAVRQRAWRAADDDLRRHVEDCPACAEVAAVCEALADDRDALRSTLGSGNRSLPSAGQVWHRATLRARAEGLQSASRSLVWAYGIAGAAVVGLTAAFVSCVLADGDRRIEADGLDGAGAVDRRRSRLAAG